MPFLITALFVFAVAGIAQTAVQLPKGITKVTSVEGITEYKLDNGLRVLLFPDQTKQTITVNITYLVGSRHENYGETGMAHLLEHLVFKGSPKHPNISKELTERGASPNGTTFYDRTNYFETFAATDDNLDWALDLEADRMVNSFIKKEDLDSEFSVVRNEFESGENNPFRVTWQRLMAAAFEWHNYGKTTIGARSDIENVPIDRLQAFYRKYYQPDNAVLLVAGKFDEAKTLDLINKKFGVIQKPSRTIDPIYTVEPTQDGEREVTVRRVGDIQMLMLGYKIPPGAHIDNAALSVLTEALTNTPSGILYKKLVETKKASSVSAFHFELHDPGYLFFIAEVDKAGDLQDVKNILLETVEKIGPDTVTKEEVERVKTQSLKNVEMTLNDPNRVGLGMSEYIAQGDWRLFFIKRDRVKDVSVEDVQRVAKKYFKRSNRTVSQYLPTDAPDRAEIPSVSAEELAKLVSEYKGGEAIAPGEAFDPTPANIMARTTVSKVGNIDVAYLPKKNRGETVFASIVFRFGDENSLKGKTDAGSFAGRLLMRGTAKRSRQQIQDEFDRLKARVFVSGGMASANVSIETTKENLLEVIDLVAEILKEPSFPENEFETMKAQTLTGLESGRSEPTNIAVEAMSKHFNRYPKGDVRYSRTLDENLEATKAVTLDDVKAFHKEFYGASVGQAAFIGDFDPDAVSKKLTQHFGNWKNPKPYKRISYDYFDVPAVNETFETPDKANAFFLARTNVKMNTSAPDYPALQIAREVIGGGFLNSRLATRIRQKDGLSYGVGAGLQVSSIDEDGVFIANAIYAPENRDKLEKAFREEIDRVIKDGITEDELKSVKQGYLLAQQRQRAADSSIASMWVNNLFLKRDFGWTSDLEKRIEALTVEQVNAAIKKYITADKISVFKAGDFAKAAKAAQ